jgi:hypothetical protein
MEQGALKAAVTMITTLHSVTTRKGSKSLDNLSTASENLRSNCVAAYTIKVLIDILDMAYTNYTDINNGYDAMFGYYVTYIEHLVPEILKAAFMFNISNSGTNWDNIGDLPNLGYGMRCEETLSSFFLSCLSISSSLC